VSYDCRPHPHHQAHEGIPQCGSFEVRFPDGRESRYFYWDDIPGRRLRPEMLTQEDALAQAKGYAGAERERGG